MATFERVDSDGDLNSGKSIFNIWDQWGGQAQLTQEEAGQLMRWLRSFLDPLPSLHGEQVLRQIIDALFQIAEPGAVKNALWARYQGIEGASPSAAKESEEYTLYWHPSEMYTARLAYGDDRPLWGSERLELKQGDRWIPGKVGYLVPGGGLVLWPREKAGNPEYIVLTVGSIVRNVSEPRGDGGGPEA